jgi:hypothetical protein
MGRSPEINGDRINRMKIRINRISKAMNLAF